MFGQYGRLKQGIEGLDEELTAERQRCNALLTADGLTNEAVIRITTRRDCAMKTKTALREIIRYAETGILPPA